MRQPPGYAEAGKEKWVCRLKRSIYGLKQSARCWNRALHSALVNQGFKQCQSDSCLYVKSDGEQSIFLLVYVDDLLLACAEKSTADEVFVELRKNFEVTQLGAAKHFLGHEIRCSSGIYSLRLKGYIEALVLKFGLSECNPSKTLMEQTYIKADNTQKPFEDNTLYRSLLGALLYIAVNARTEVAFSVGLLGRKVSSLTETDWKAAKRVARYLKGTKDVELTFGPGNGWSLLGYSDADWAGDQESRKSTSGFIFFFGFAPIVWNSHKQSSVTLSSMEAEFVALSEASQELIWLRRLMADLGQTQNTATIIHEDNQSCMSFVKAAKVSKRSKHIDDKQHFIRDLVDQKQLQLVYCPTERMVADTLTKPLGINKFQTTYNLLGLTSNSGH